MRVLIVEDEALLAWTMEDLLSGAGHEVSGPVSTVKSAIALSEDNVPDLAFLDINLHHGDQNGADLARILAERWEVPSVFVTGNPDRARAQPRFAFGLIVKPYWPETILDTVTFIERCTAYQPLTPCPQGLEIFERVNGRKPSSSPTGT